MTGSIAGAAKNGTSRAAGASLQEHIAQPASAWRGSASTPYRALSGASSRSSTTSPPMQQSLMCTSAFDSSTRLVNSMRKAFAPRGGRLFGRDRLHEAAGEWRKVRCEKSISAPRAMHECYRPQSSERAMRSSHSWLRCSFVQLRFACGRILRGRQKGVLGLPSLTPWRVAAAKR